MNEKRRKAEMLLEAVGDIDDALLSEAMNYRKKPTYSTKAVAMAASFALIFCLVAGALIIGRLDLLKNDFNYENMGGNNPSDSEMDDPTGDGSNNSLVLDSIFTSLADRERYDYVTDPDTLPYYGGKAYIVWRYEGIEKYYLSEPLRDVELETIKSVLGQGSYAGESSPQIKVKVWILLGNGRVISPYLIASNGNISNEIFDYDVEIIPNDSFAQKLESVLS